MLFVYNDLGLWYFQRMHASHTWIIYATCSKQLRRHPTTIPRNLINQISVLNVLHVRECSILFQHDMVLLSIECNQYLLAGISSEDRIWCKGLE